MSFSDLYKVTQLATLILSLHSVWNRYFSEPYCCCLSPHPGPSQTYTIHFSNNALFIIDTHLRLTDSNFALKQYLIYLKAWDWVRESFAVCLFMPRVPSRDGVMRMDSCGGAVWTATTRYIPRVKNVPNLAPNHHHSESKSWVESMETDISEFFL